MTLLKFFGITIIVSMTVLYLAGMISPVNYLIFWICFSVSYFLYSP